MEQKCTANLSLSESDGLRLRYIFTWKGQRPFQKHFLRTTQQKPGKILAVGGVLGDGSGLGRGGGPGNLWGCSGHSSGVKGLKF